MSGYKCHFCAECDGHGCLGELPGMGGVFESANFIDNCAAWKKYRTDTIRDDELPPIRLAPITGGVENVGYNDEAAFYFDLIEACAEAGFLLSIGDGCPDAKIQGGLAALQRYKKTGAVFIKPYPNARIFERIDWVRSSADLIGIDIDSYNIVTMRNLVQLEQKDARSLKELQRYAKMPFAIKGIFLPENVELVKELRPDVAVISNHGGRIETRRGSTADFLAEYGDTLRKFAGEVWVDGGLRSRTDIAAAKQLGAAQVMIGRPCITALLSGGVTGVRKLYRRLTED
ncbi:dehydrogenase, FMN-dependent [Treponema vincentii ATCC 35580]|uniref:Dehydrogenase, FMN-dependent n=1 Tax=Treponema vincentii ATCC 35580 TaxID=596324 RepID=C8PTK3_9SPIR|nr:alpha-hydroxy-acid oxidizing protein [Treponema vincentii]EEV19249.1 dehydrogenase, FMN-dependent [Treponema vincentii ATCC 35580]